MMKRFADMKSGGAKIAALTSYDASFAKLLHEAGVDIQLVGDSLGMTMQGRTSTFAVTLDDIAYHTRCVRRGCAEAFVVGDLPFGTFQASPAQAFESAAKLVAAGANMVKLEGGAEMAETVSFIVRRGIPVCAHVGFTPQSINAIGGHKVQGRGAAAAALEADAVAMQDAGASLLVLEMIPASLAASLTASLTLSTIGVGAGPDCDGQVLVLQDMLGIYHGKSPRFSRNFMDGAASVRAAVESFVAAVKDGGFPTAEHSF